MRGPRRLRGDTAREMRDRLGADAIVCLDPAARFFGPVRAGVAAVETTRWHRGKGSLRLLRVRFVDLQGMADTAAWEVRELDAWLRTLGDPRPEPVAGT